MTPDRSRRRWRQARLAPLASFTAFETLDGFVPLMSRPSAWPARRRRSRLPRYIWSRRNPDGQSAHEEPTLGVTNHAYVRVKNRGTQAANNVTVKLFQADPAGGLTWPTGWTPAATPQVNAPGAIPPGGEVMVGPFAWRPQVAGDERLLASASAPGDLSNADTVNGPLAPGRLVPLDNNIATRTVAPVGGNPTPAPWLEPLLLSD